MPADAEDHDRTAGESTGEELAPGDAGARSTAEILAALAYGEQLGADRAGRNVGLAPDGRSRSQQQHIADLELRNWELVDARLHELKGEAYVDVVRPFFDAFFAQTEPADWVEAQTFHYVGDALVSDFADGLVPLLDRVSGEVIRLALRDREAQETFALDELQRTLEDDPSSAERIADYARKIVGEALTQTSRALEATEGLRLLLGGSQAGKRFILTLLDSHRQRLDRLGIETVETD
ncbi:MAG: ferritin-like domain-containing protein [Thermoplasmata archaeon]|nr:ferritin-like domain-containing protein [Thermoplasmata archaeon]